MMISDVCFVDLKVVARFPAKKRMLFWDADISTPKEALPHYNHAGEAAVIENAFNNVGLFRHCFPSCSIFPKLSSHLILVYRGNKILAFLFHICYT
jgi:hypothetical protein